MKNCLTKSLLGAAAALLFVGSANAYVIDFESPDTSGLMMSPLMLDGESITQGNYSIQMQDANNPVGPDWVSSYGLLGQLSNGTNAESCPYGNTCPRGNSTNFLSVLDDGIVHIANTGTGASMSFSSLQAAYVPSTGNTTGSTVYLAVEADRVDGSYGVYYYPLATNGAFTNVSATTGGTLLGGTGTLTSGPIADLFIYGLYCDASTGKCNAFDSNRAQFALDNVALDVSAVPEPSEWLLMAAGLGAVGAIVRRRKNSAAA